jgi:hypothetical protein
MIEQRFDSMPLCASWFNPGAGWPMRDAAMPGSTTE